MNFSLVFINSGDYLSFKATNPEIADYFIDRLDELDQRVFYPMSPGQGSRIQQRLDNFKNDIEQINQWFELLTSKKYPEFSDPTDYLDQRLLNFLHAFWVGSMRWKYDIDQQRIQKNHTEFVEKIHDMFPDDQRTPFLSTVLSRLGLLDQYNRLNEPHIHGIERSFSDMAFHVTSDEWIEWPNPFVDSTSNNICNLYLRFNHLGRTLDYKYESFDFDLEFDDENSFNEILPIVGVSLTPPRTIPHAVEYLDWCKEKNRKPVGNQISLGNVINLYENLKEYRIIILRNLLNNNGFILQKDRT